jgi:hypothetical protein
VPPSSSTSRPSSTVVTIAGEEHRLAEAGGALVAPRVHGLAQVCDRDEAQGRGRAQRHAIDDVALAHRDVTEVAQHLVGPEGAVVVARHQVLALVVDRHEVEVLPPRAEASGIALAEHQGIVDVGPLVGVVGAVGLDELDRVLAVLRDRVVVVDRAGGRVEGQATEDVAAAEQRGDRGGRAIGADVGGAPVDVAVGVEIDARDPADRAIRRHRRRDVEAVDRRRRVADRRLPRRGEQALVGVDRVVAVGVGGVHEISRAVAVDPRLRRGERHHGVVAPEPDDVVADEDVVVAIVELAGEGHLARGVDERRADGRDRGVAGGGVADAQHDPRGDGRGLGGAGGGGEGGEPQGDACTGQRQALHAVDDTSRGVVLRETVAL